MNVETIAESIGVAAPALRLLISIFLGYPIAVLHRNLIHNQPPTVHHIYFAGSGLALGYFNFGLSIGHCLITTLISYGIIFIFNKRPAAIVLSWIFNLGYLCIGYYYTETSDYDILWTMPHCILCLRLIGLTYDVYDSMQPGAPKKSQYLNEMPNILAVLGFAFFPTAFLIGPQFSMSRYLSFVNNNYDTIYKNNVQLKPESTAYAMRRLLEGTFYMAVAQIGCSYFPNDYLLSSEFGAQSFAKRMLVLGLWGRFNLYKYSACWLLTDSTCSLLGLTYNGRNEKTGVCNWDGCVNIKMSIFNNTTQFNHYIQSFNCNTNNWIAEYCYKRLKFLNSKLISQAVSLTFLAIWHGFHSGYFVTFLCEFVIMYCERDFISLMKKHENVFSWLNQPFIAINVRILLMFYTLIFMGFSLIPFIYRIYPRYTLAYYNVSYAGFYFFFLWPLYKLPLKYLLKFIDRHLSPYNPAGSSTSTTTTNTAEH